MSGAAGRVAGTVDVVTAGSVEVTREGPLGTFGSFGMFGPKDCGTGACGTKAYGTKACPAVGTPGG